MRAGQPHPDADKRVGTPRRVSDQLIFDAVKGCLERSGGDRFTMGEVAEAAGLTRVQLHNRFGSKKILLLSFLVDYARSFKQACRDQMLESADLLDAIANGLLAGIREVDRDPYVRMLIVPAALGEFDDEIAAHEVLAIGREQWLPVLARGVQEQCLRSDLDLEQTAEWLLFTELSLLVARLNFDKTYADCEAFIERFVMPTLR